MEREPTGRGGRRLLIGGGAVAVVLLATAAAVVLGAEDDDSGAGDRPGERCDLGFNTAAYNATAPEASPGDIEHHALHGEEPVTFTVAEWAATFTDESLGVPASAVAAGAEANPMIRDSVLSGQLTTSLDPDPWVPLTDPAQCDRLAGELAQARAAAARYPTVADALAAGYIEVSMYAPGQGAHYLKMAARTARSISTSPRCSATPATLPTPRSWAWPTTSSPPTDYPPTERSASPDRTTAGTAMFPCA